MKRSRAKMSRLIQSDGVLSLAQTTGCQPRLALSTGWRIGVTLLLSSAAFMVRTPQAVVAVALVNLLWIWLCAVPWSVLRRALRPFVVQTLVLLFLYALQQGQAGLPRALQVSCQMALTMIPGMVLVVAVPSSQLVRSLARWMPDQAAFVLASSLHFFPLVLAEWRQLYQVQLLRGAPLLPRELWRPWHWPTIGRCLVVPAVVLALALAHEIALAARARNFSGGRRSCWQEDE